MNKELNKIISDYNKRWERYPSINYTDTQNAINILNNKIRKIENNTKMIPYILEAVKKYGNKVYNKRFFDFLEKELTETTGYKTIGVYGSNSRYNNDKILNICFWDNIRNVKDCDIEIIINDCIVNNRINQESFINIIDKILVDYSNKMNKLLLNQNNLNDIIVELNNIINQYNAIIYNVDTDVTRSWDVKRHLYN